MKALGWMWRHKVLTVIGAIVLLGLLGSVLPDPEATTDESTATSSPSPTASEEPTSPSDALAAEEGTADPSVDPAPAETPAPTETAPPPTQRQVWLTNYASQEPNYLGLVAAALAVDSAPDGSDISAVRACAEVKNGVSLPKRVTRYARRTGSSPTPDQAIAALDATVQVVCPELAGAQAEQVAVRAAGIKAAATKARQEKARAAAAAREAEAQQQREEDAAVSTYYANCTEVENAGAAPIYRGDPGYSSDLDRDGDGVACET